MLAIIKKLRYEMPAHKGIHIAKSLKIEHTSQNLSISMSLPTLQKESKVIYENTTKE